MNFIESISNYVLENYSIRDIPKIAEIAINENLESESIYILAGMTKNDNSFEILNYFQKSLRELKINLPSKEQAAKILTKYYLSLIIQNIDYAFEIMQKIDTEVYKKSELKNPNAVFFGEELNIECVYTWYREIQDWKDNGRLLYYAELSRDEQLKKYKEHLVEEVKESLKNNYT